MGVSVLSSHSSSPSSTASLALFTATTQAHNNDDAILPHLNSNEATPLLPPSSSSPKERAYATLPSPPASSSAKEAASADLEAGTNAPSSSRGVLTIIAVLLIGVFVANADGSIALATHPVIASEFGRLAESSWVVTAFSLAGCGVQPLYGKLSDIYGRKAVLLVAYLLFAVGLLGCGAGASLTQVIIGRAISGAGGAGMMALVSILITDLVPLRAVAAWRSYVNVFATMGRSLGGPLGGYMADTIGWRWSFTGQVPLIGLAAILTWLLIPDRPAATAAASASDPSSPTSRSSASKLSRLDLAGCFLLASTILTFTLPLTLGGQTLPWTHPAIPLLLLTSLLLGTLFALTETRWAHEPILPPSLLLTSASVPACLAIMLCTVAAQLGMMFTLPLYFQITSVHTSAGTAGAHLFPAVVGNAAGGIATGYWIRRTGRYHAPLILAGALGLSCYLSLLVLWDGHPSGHGLLTNWLAIVPGGLACGIAQSAAFVALSASVARPHLAIASATLYLAAGLGTVLGLAAAGAAVQTGLRRGLVGSGVQREVVERVLADVGFVRGLEGEMRRVVVAVYVQAIAWGHWVSVVFSATALLAAGWGVREKRL